MNLPPDLAVRWWLGVFLGIVLIERMFELALSTRNAARVKARGAREHGAGHFPLLVLVHVLFFLFLVVEVAWLGARPGPAWPWWSSLWLAAQALRVAAIHALGDRWNVRILVIPGAPLVKRGPYGWLQHPNYLAVVLELIAGPMMFGAWRTAAAVSALNAIALWIRVRAENRALGRAGGFDAGVADQAGGA